MTFAYRLYHYDLLKGYLTIAFIFSLPASAELLSEVEYFKHLYSDDNLLLGLILLVAWLVVIILMGLFFCSIYASLTQQMLYFPNLKEAFDHDALYDEIPPSFLGEGGLPSRVLLVLSYFVFPSITLLLVFYKVLPTTLGNPTVENTVVTLAAIGFLLFTIHVLAVLFRYASRGRRQQFETLLGDYPQHTTLIESQPQESVSKMFFI